RAVARGPRVGRLAVPEGSARALFRLGRDCRELLPHDLRRFDDRDALLDALLDRARLEPAVWVRPEPLRRNVPQPLADAIRSLLNGLGRMGVDVDDPDGELLCERVPIEQVEPAIAVVRHRE